MKRFRSNTLKSIALLYMGFPMTYIVSAALLFDIPGERCVRILLAPSYFIACVLAVAAGYALWEVYRWGWYLFVVANVFISYINALYVNEYGESNHKAIAFAVSTAFIFAVIYRVSREIRVPYFFPKIRWWESNPRYKLAVPVRLTRKDGTPIEGQILDLSMGGCFIKLRQEVDSYEPLTVEFSAFGFKVLCNGVVVWRTRSTVTHPKGVGLKFGALVRAQKRALRQVTGRLKRISQLYRRSRYLLNEEDFIAKLEKIESGARESRLRAMTSAVGSRIRTRDARGGGESAAETVGGEEGSSSGTSRRS